jgi:Tol biopolymer transport system component
MTVDELGRQAARGVRRVTDPRRAPGRDPVERFDRFRTRKRRNQRIGVVALVLLIAVPAIALAVRALRPTDVPVATPALPAGRIVFGTWHSGVQRADWFTSAPDGSDVLDLHVSATCAAWWPDGNSIWITNDAAQRPGHPLRPAIIRPDGSGLRPLDATKDSDLNLGCGDVSSDGRRMVMEGFNEAKQTVNGIYSVRASDGGDLVRLTHGHDGYPGYAPDDSQVVFQRTKPGVVPDQAGALFVVNADGTGLHRITPWGDAFLQQSWSPDGAWILFQKPYGQPYLVHPDGRDLHPLPVSLPAGAGARQLDWSPDGSWIVFSLGQGDEAAIAIVRADGTDLRVIVDGTGAIESDPHWGPPST